MLEKSLPSSYYTTPEIFEQERQKISSREWLCAGREEDLPAPGDTLVLELAGESILVARTKAGELKAHHNVCRHRGARLCTPEQDARWNVKLPGGITSAGTIRCPYHQWTYGLDGQLLSAPFLNDSEGFSKADFSLYPVHLETWGGFLFLNLSSGALRQTLLQQLGQGAERLVRYPLHELLTGHTLTYDVAANWKLILENYNECYHCGGVHPELCEVVPDFKRAGGFSLDWERGIPHREGAYTFTRSGTTSRHPFDGLNDDEKVRHKGELLYPNLMCSVSCDHAAVFLLWPEAPNRTRIVCRFLFHPSEIEKPGFDASDAVEFWDLVNRQDWAICERVQMGVESRVHEFGYYAPMENPSLDIRRYVLQRLSRE